MNPSAFVWAAFGGAFVLFAVEALLVWRASARALREREATARVRAPVTLRPVSRGPRSGREP
ncbi:hypothetical protein [Caballeronia telluris]|uniref:Heme exporter protein D n=1 Tax=Caballeronia telluris TaxID=326475 RepID=A0A158K425_9BURK|nr:hypothetical protein [Caballeronia telluris]SAL75493.1 hypothetical protein AWB66_05205 [Caballeronia telluris]